MTSTSSSYEQMKHLLYRRGFIVEAATSKHTLLRRGHVTATYSYHDGWTYNNGECTMQFSIDAFTNEYGVGL